MFQVMDMFEFNVNALDMPRIGCEVNSLDWQVTSQMLDNIFVNSHVQLRVYINYN